MNLGHGRPISAKDRVTIIPKRRAFWIVMNGQDSGKVGSR